MLTAPASGGLSPGRVRALANRPVRGGHQAGISTSGAQLSTKLPGFQRPKAICRPLWGNCIAIGLQCCDKPRLHEVPQFFIAICVIRAVGRGSLGDLLSCQSRSAHLELYPRRGRVGAKFGDAFGFLLRLLLGRGFSGKSALASNSEHLPVHQARLARSAEPALFAFRDQKITSSSPERAAEPINVKIAVSRSQG